MVELLQSLGVAIGLPLLAGINLYLTTFVTGLAIRMQWIQLAPRWEGLEILADPMILTVSGFLLLLEFVVDKIPHVDSAWDTIHTVIRPIGGAFLALRAIGDVDPVLETIALLAGGSVAFTSHSAKAGTRVLINTSPEPVSNIVMSFAEDLIVVGGTWFAFRHPMITFISVLIVVVTFWFYAPKFFRMVKTRLIGILHRFSARRHTTEVDLFALNHRPRSIEKHWQSMRLHDEQCVWVLPCYTAKLEKIGANVKGFLVGTNRKRILFFGKKNYRTQFSSISLDRLDITDDPGAVFHTVRIRTEGGNCPVFRFTRKFALVIPSMLRWMRDQSALIDMNRTRESALVRR